MDLTKVEEGLRADLASMDAEIAELTKPPQDSGSIAFGKRIGDGTNEAIDRFNSVGVANDIEVIRENTIRALAKLEEGTYGTCDKCGTEIPEGRLHAVPSSVLCIECARKLP